MKTALYIVMIALFGVVALATSDADLSVIAKRRQLMKELAGHTKAIGRLIDTPTKSAAKIRKHALAMRALAVEMPTLFKPGTGFDAVSAPRTGAKPAIWAQWQRFEAAARRLVTESDRLGRLASNTGKSQLRLQFAATTMGGCGNCHKAFRKKLD